MRLCVCACVVVGQGRVKELDCALFERLINVLRLLPALLRAQAATQHKQANGHRVSDICVSGGVVSNVDSAVKHTHTQARVTTAKNGSLSPYLRFRAGI